MIGICTAYMAMFIKTALKRAEKKSQGLFLLPFIHSVAPNVSITNYFKCFNDFIHFNLNIPIFISLSSNIF